MRQYKLNSGNIELIRIDNKVTLFFHTDTLQLYPLEDTRLIEFLKRYSDLGYEKTKDFYGYTDFREIYEFLTDTIESAPNSTAIKSDTAQINFSAVVLPIAGKCNLKCPYCFAQTGNGFNFSDFNCESIEKTVDFLAEKNKEDKKFTIIFFGGEPLINFEVMEHTVEYVKDTYSDYSVSYSITTNGTIINDKIVHFFRENNVAILVSLDGPDNDFNLRLYKDGSKSIYKVLENLEILRQNKIPVQLRATLVSTNPYIVDTYDFFERLGYPFDIVFAYASGNKTNEDLSAYNAGTLGAIKTNFDLLIEYYVNKLKNKEPIYSKALLSIAENIKYRIKRDIACGAGYSYFTIIENGDIFACPHLMNEKQYRIGCIHSDIIDNKDSVSISVDKIEGCKECWVKNLCLGGCPSEKILTDRRNVDTLGNSECELEKLKFEFLLKLYYHTSKLAPEYLEKPDSGSTMPV